MLEMNPSPTNYCTTRQASAKDDTRAFSLRATMARIVIEVCMVAVGAISLHGGENINLDAGEVDPIVWTMKRRS